jgi:hypothetical protein
MLNADLMERLAKGTNAMANMRGRLVLNTDNSLAEVETSADGSLFYLMSLA